MTFAERTAAVASLGFNSRQAAFLTLVALHSGYCVRRQYAAFIGRKNCGNNVVDFMERLVDRGFASRAVFRVNRGAVYHVRAWRLYAAIGRPDDFNQRSASPAVVARKLMLLDFVIAHAGLEWYATGPDKVQLFANQCGVPESALSAVRTPRYGIHAGPIFRSAAPPSINFVSLVTDPRASAVETFVRGHAPLLRHLDSWALHVVSRRGASTEDAARAAYQRGLTAASLTPVTPEDLEWFRRAREQVLRGDLSELEITDLSHYRELAARLGDGLNGPRPGPLVFHVLAHDYSQFGSFPGVA